MFCPKKYASEWKCAFSIEIGGRKEHFDAHGEDSLQALTLAVQGVEKNLRLSYPTASWIDPELGHGLPVIFHLHLPRIKILDLYDRIEQEIDKTE